MWSGLVIGRAAIRSTVGSVEMKLAQTLQFGYDIHRKFHHHLSRLQSFERWLTRALHWAHISIQCADFGTISDDLVFLRNTLSGSSLTFQP